MKKATFAQINRWVPSRPQETIIVAGAPRSGTTWLAELLRELPGYKLINEPLRLSTNPKAREAGFDWRTHIEPSAAAPVRKKHLRKVLQGNVELGPAWHFRSENPVLKLKELITHRRNVVKFCRAGRMLHWMADEIEVRDMIVIVRHPCAVISSMLNMGDNWAPRDDVQNQPIEERFAGDIPANVRSRLQEIQGLDESWVGHLAVGWCLDHYFAFMSTLRILKIIRGS